MPYYPDFAPLTMAMHDEYQGRIQIFPCYTEFSFADLFAWNTNGATQVSLLNGNIVIIRPDYTDHRPLLTFIGLNKIEETINRLLSDAVGLGTERLLHNIPEEIINSIKPNTYTIDADHRHWDYVLDAKEHSSLIGGKYASMRSKINKFRNLYGGKTEISVLPHTQESYDQIMALFDRWQISSRKSPEDTNHEKAALIKILNNISAFKARITAVHINDMLAGITINVPQANGYEMGMFLKFDYQYSRLFEFLVHATSQHAHIDGYQYINFQQDLGIASLRNAKMELHPCKFFHKYTIALTSDRKVSEAENRPVHNIAALPETLFHA